MAFIHFDEARAAAVAAVREWMGAGPPALRALLIVDLTGKLRLLLWSGAPIEAGPLDAALRERCGPWWTGELLRVDDLDQVTQGVYEAAWSAAQVDAGEPKVRVHDRHRNRTAWFADTESPWAAPEGGPPIVVFYSFKGGLGRSTVLASFAIQRARAGERVCVLDFDLDSPGVGRLLAADASGLTARWGVVDFLLEHPAGDAPLADYYHRCDRVAGDGEIIVFPAGNLDETYPEKLARVDMEEAPGAREGRVRTLLQRVRDELGPRWILLDARTGISESAGQLLAGIAHLHVLLGTTQEQSWQGLSLVLDRLGKGRVVTDRLQAEVLLIQAMVPAREAGRLARDAFVARAERDFTERYYAEATEGQDEDRFWTMRDLDSLDAPHVPVPLDYETRLASFDDIAEVADFLCAGDYSVLAERIATRFSTETDG